MSTDGDTQNPDLLSITEDEYGHLMRSLGFILTLTKEGGCPIEEHEAALVSYTRLFHAGVERDWLAEDGTLRLDT